MRILKGLAALALAAAMTAPASAAVINIASGETQCDSYNSMSVATRAACATNVNIDLGQPPSTDVVNFSGSGGTLLGWVQDQRRNTGLYADAATVNLATKSLLTFTIFNFDAIFRGTLDFAGIVVDQQFDSGFTTMQFMASAGSYSFEFDAADPNERRSNTTEYTLEVAAVPLPAAGLLLAGALGGLGLMRRRKKS